MSLSSLELIALVLLGVAVALSVVRFLLGPTSPDRVVAADTLSIMVTAGLAWSSSLLDSPLYLSVALIYGTLAFVGTVAIARAIEGDRT